MKKNNSTKNIFLLSILIGYLIFNCSDVMKAQKLELIHPGGWHTAEDIQRIRTNLSKFKQPYYSVNMVYMGLNVTAAYQPSPVPLVSRDKIVNTGRSNFETDCYNAYLLMVKWIATNDISYADAAIRVLDGWSGTLTTLSGSDIKLLVGPVGGKFAQVAELAAYARPDWPNKARAQAMFKNIFYPVIAVGASSNWGTACVDGIMSIGIFCNDTTLFKEAIDRYKNGFPGNDGCAGVTFYIDSSGQNAEANRDLAHPQGGVAHLLEVAVSAWNQGIDLFSYGNYRLRDGLEYLAKYNLGYTVPCPPFVDVCGLNTSPNGISSIARAKFSKLWEMAYNYCELSGSQAPCSKMVAMQCTPESSENEMAGYGTLTFRRDAPGKSIQTITFPAITSKVLSNPDFLPGASASSGLPVVYSSSNPTAASITADGKIHLEGGGTTIIYAYQLGDSIYSPVISSKSFTVTRDAYQRLEAENYNSMLGIQTEITQDVDGVMNLSYVDATDWTAYSSLNFGSKGATKFIVRYAVLAAATTFEVRLGSQTGTLVGTMPLPVTGGNQTWKTDSCQISGAVNVQDVYLVYHGRVNVNWFKFSNVSTLSDIQENKVGGEDFQLYPIPANNSLNVDYDYIPESGIKMTIHDFNGKIVRAQYLNSIHNTVDIETLPPGVYIVSFADSKNVRNKKLIKF